MSLKTPITGKPVRHMLRCWETGTYLTQVTASNHVNADVQRRDSQPIRPKTGIAQAKKLLIVRQPSEKPIVAVPRPTVLNNSTVGYNKDLVLKDENII